MKKLFLIAAVAMLATVACKDDKTDDIPTDAPKATITAAPTSVAIGTNGAFNVALDKPATAETIITVTNTGDAFLTVTAKEIKIAKGASAGSATFTGKAKGSAKVTFASNSINIITPEVAVTVTEVAPPSNLKDYCEPFFPPSFAPYARLAGATIGSVTLPETYGHDFLDLAHEGTNKVTLSDGINIVVKFANINSGAADDYGIGVYIDWNKDGKFSGAEKIGEKTIQAGDNEAEQDVTIALGTIPADAVLPTTMRIVSGYTGEGNIIPKDGCGEFESGSVIDVEVNK